MYNLDEINSDIREIALEEKESPSQELTRALRTMALEGLISPDDFPPPEHTS